MLFNFHRNADKPSLIDEVKRVSGLYLPGVLLKSNATLIAPDIIEFLDVYQAYNFFAEVQLVVPDAPTCFNFFDPTNFRFSDAVFPLNPSTNKPLTRDDNGNRIDYSGQNFTKILVTPPIHGGLLAGLREKGIMEWSGRFEGGKHIKAEATATTTASTTTTTASLSTSAREERKSVPAISRPRR